MLDHSADKISTEEAAALVEALAAELGSEQMRFYPCLLYTS